MKDADPHTITTVLREAVGPRYRRVLLGLIVALAGAALWIVRLESRITVIERVEADQAKRLERLEGVFDQSYLDSVKEHHDEK